MKKLIGGVCGAVDIAIQAGNFLSWCLFTVGGMTGTRFKPVGRRRYAENERPVFRMTQLGKPVYGASIERSQEFLRPD